MVHRNISIVWDFDGTLTPKDSTSEILRYFLGRKKKEIEQFWRWIKAVNGTTSDNKWERMLASDAPTWMYVLSRLAFYKNTPLTKDFFSKKEITHLVALYPNVNRFLRCIKRFNNNKRFINRNIHIHHFIVTAGLKDYVEALFPQNIFSHIWGCRYNCVYHPNYKDEIESIPVFCMDQTMKTRALYEISKGVFTSDSITTAVNDKVSLEKLWSPFNNFIYIGDGPTDIPALSLIRAFGGYGIVVFDKNKNKNKVHKHLKNMSADSRCDLITKADFSINSELFNFIKNRCYQIVQKYEAEDFSKNNS